MSEWHPYRIKDIAQLISIKSEDLTLPYIALDNIISWDATFVPSDSATDGNRIYVKRAMFCLANYDRILLKHIYQPRSQFVLLNFWCSDLTKAPITNSSSISSYRNHSFLTFAIK